MSPLLSNLALSVLDDHYAQGMAGRGHDLLGQAVASTQGAGDLAADPLRGRFRRAGRWHPRACRGAARGGRRGACLDGAASVGGQDQDLPHRRGLRLSRVPHQRHPKRGTDRRYVYTYPAKKALAAVKAKLRALSRMDRNQPLAVLLHQLNQVLRGWTSYFKHGASKRTFNYLRAFVWRRVVCWLRHKHPRANWRWLRRRYLLGWWPTHGEVMLVNPGAVVVSRYRYRGRIPSPWVQQPRLIIRESR
jgi:RNA-directed DNA polymerase